MYMQQLLLSLSNVSRILQIVGHDDVDSMNVSKSPHVVGGVCAVLIFKESIAIFASV